MLNPPTYEDDLTVRISGTIGDPNELAALLVAGTAFAGILAVTTKEAALRVAAGSAVVLFLAGIIYTVSRGGLLALFVALIAACLLAGRWRGRTLVVTALGLMTMVIYFASFAGLDARDRVTTVEGGSGRTDIWKVGWRMVEDKPITGIGSGNFPISSIHYLLQPGVLERDEFIIDTPKVAHNTYLHILAELGIVGLALFLTIIGFAMSCALKAARWFGRAGDHALELFARGMIVAPRRHPGRRLLHLRAVRQTALAAARPRAGAVRSRTPHVSGGEAAGAAPAGARRQAHPPAGTGRQVGQWGS